MRSVRLLVLHHLRKCLLNSPALEMPLVEYDPMIEQVLPAAADEAFSDSVLPWAAEGDTLRIDGEALKRAQHLFATRSKIRYFGAESYLWRSGSLANPAPPDPLGHIKAKHRKLPVYSWLSQVRFSAAM